MKWGTKIKTAIDQAKWDSRRDAAKLSADDPTRQELLAQAAKADDEAPLLREPVHVGLMAPSAPAHKTLPPARESAHASQRCRKRRSCRARRLWCLRTVEKIDWHLSNY